MFGLAIGTFSLFAFLGMLFLLVSLLFQSIWAWVGLVLVAWWVRYTIVWHLKRARAKHVAPATTQQAPKPVLPTALDD